jgi:hypothetical protein
MTIYILCVCGIILCFLCIVLLFKNENEKIRPFLVNLIKFSKRINSINRTGCYEPNPRPTGIASETNSQRANLVRQANHNE